jgi:hypothetical protein
MTLVWASGYNGIPDPDAQVYIAAVEAADGQTLEEPVQFAIHEFVAGCKYDGIWDAIKASCILAGARTLAGALVPLKGIAPTNFNFVAGDYNRETGLKGDGSTKYLDSNRAQNTDPVNSAHLFLNVTTADSRYTQPIPMGYAGASNSANTSRLAIGPYDDVLYFNNRSGPSQSGAGNLTGGIGSSRESSTGYSVRRSGASATLTVASVAPDATRIAIFGFYTNGVIGAHTNARLSFYSIGESLDLALLDNRVSTLMTDIGAAIP